jgi:hypothetical protein
MVVRRVQTTSGEPSPEQPAMRTPVLTANFVSTLCLATLLGGCLDHPLKAVDYEKVITPETEIVLEPRDVDILFVIDNSGSMADEQARLARNFTGFVDALDAMKVDYRVAITTTDVDHKACEDATPENGDLVLRSCSEAVAAGAFEFNGTDASAACTDQCKLSAADLEIQPSLAGDGERAARPWLESIAGTRNLKDGVSMADAFACFGPQGIDGCGYESPLEAMRLAVSKARKDRGGFLRQDALLAVVFVTDEADCSTNPDQMAAFTSDPTFWNSEDPRRTSGICWRAGVECQNPAGPDLGECHAANYDLEGQSGARDEDSVLYSVDRYIDFLKGLPGASDGGPQARDVLVSLIAGVPVGYDSFAAEIAYKAAEAGSEQQLSFGVAPGCVNTEDGSNSTAIPPVREREVAEAFAREGERNLFSICQDSYVDALAQIAAAIDRELPPSCADTCVADRDPATPELEPQCTVTESLGDATRDVAACVHDGSGWKPADGASVCFYMLTDPDGRTASTLDDMTIPNGKSTPECSTDETNLEFKLLRVGPRDPNATYRATCVAAANDAACEDD